MFFIIVFIQLPSMVLVLDGNLEIDAHMYSDIDNLPQEFVKTAVGN